MVYGTMVRLPREREPHVFSNCARLEVEIVPPTAMIRIIDIMELPRLRRGGEGYDRFDRGACRVAAVARPRPPCLDEPQPVHDTTVATANDRPLERAPRRDADDAVILAACGAIAVASAVFLILEWERL
jgi:hypothetical protein